MVTFAHRLGSAIRGESTGARSVGRQYSVPTTTQPSSPWDQAVFDLDLSASSEFSLPSASFHCSRKTETRNSVSRTDSGSSASGDGHVPWSELVGITNKPKPGKLSCY